MNWINAIVQGVMLGGLYALFACGLSLMFGVMRIINLAHGDLAVLGAFLVAVVAAAVGISPFLALLLVLPVMGLVGVALQRSILAGRCAPASCRRCWPPSGSPSCCRTRCWRSSAPTVRSLDAGRAVHGRSPARVVG